MTVQQAFEVAVQHHQAGRLAEAEAIYRQILAVQPQHAGAIQHVGIIAYQMGRHEIAVEWIRQAIGLNPVEATAHSNLGAAYQALGRIDEAIASYRRALELQPEFVDARINLGKALVNQGRLDEAMAVCSGAPGPRPEMALFHGNLADVLRKKGRVDEAVAMYRRALELDPSYLEAHTNLGVALLAESRWDEAIASCRRALELRPECVEARYNLGMALAGKGRIDEAIVAYRQALELAPDFAPAHNNLGAALGALSRFDEAVAAYRRALECQPGQAEFYNNLGIALAGKGQFEEAIAVYRQALELRSDFAAVQNNLGAALAGLNRHGEAVAAIGRALESQPGSIEFHNNLANVLTESGRFHEAIAAYGRALELDPSSGEAKLGQAMRWLLLGDFERGWPRYEARWEVNRVTKREFAEPMWDGGNIEGRRVLVHAEQGFGDAIQFVRYASLIAERGGEVIVECPRPLVEIFRGAKGVREVVATGAPLPGYDFQVPMLSLPLVFQTRAESIPNDVPYLFADAARREAWKQRMGRDRNRLKVGLAWEGHPRHDRSRIRNISPEKLLPVLRLDDAEFFNLQVGGGAEQIRQLPGAAALIDHTEHIQDFADTAAMMMELDLVISVDTAVAHLAGALGRRVWALLPFVPDWRWGLEREDSPWYPTMRLFRQTSIGDWDSVVRRVVGELEGGVAAKRP